MTTPAGRPLIALMLLSAFLAPGCLGGNAPTRFYVLAPGEMTAVAGPDGGELALEARWRILDSAGREMAAKTTRLTEATGGAGYSPMVSAMSRALAALSREMAQALAALPQ